MYTARNAENIKVLVTGLVGGAELPFPGLKRYICKATGNENFCPQKSGQEYTATINLPILSVFPNVSWKNDLSLFHLNMLYFSSQIHSQKKTFYHPNSLLR